MYFSAKAFNFNELIIKDKQNASGPFFIKSLYIPVNPYKFHISIGLYSAIYSAWWLNYYGQDMGRIKRLWENSIWKNRLKGLQ